MSSRKEYLRTIEALDGVFERLPDSDLCFDHDDLIDELYKLFAPCVGHGCEENDHLGTSKCSVCGEFPICEETRGCRGCKHAVCRACAQNKCDECDSCICAQCDEAAHDCPCTRKRPASGAARTAKRARCE
jgi:hypothetical protein